MMKKVYLVFCLLVLVFASYFLHLRGGRLGPDVTSGLRDHLEGVLLYAQEEEIVTDLPASEAGSAEVTEGEYDFTSMTTYEMFWPVVAGKVPGDRFYQLKVWRDKFLGYLFFSKLKKSEYLKRLANKRLVEAEKLLTLQRESYFSETIKKSRNYLEKGLVLLSEAPETEAQFWLKDEYVKDLQKHLIVLERMKEKVEENQREVIEESVKKINDLISQYEVEI